MPEAALAVDVVLRTIAGRRTGDPRRRLRQRPPVPAHAVRPENLDYPSLEESRVADES